jgi:hypothetical protein
VAAQRASTWNLAKATWQVSEAAKPTQRIYKDGSDVSNIMVQIPEH